LRPELGDGAQVVAPLLAAPLPPGAPPGSLYTFFPVKFAPGNRAADLAQLRARVDPSGACPLAPCVDARQEPAPVRSYTSALPIEYILVGFVSLLGLAAVSYVVGASIRRRRRDFAILEAMGLTRRQLWHTLTWQASTIGAIALIVGIPAGILLGRLSWRAFAQALGVGADPLVPGDALGIVGAATALTVLAIAGFFYASFRHSRPAVALRTE
jgi:putative ABC transport system permease protein